MGRRRTCSIATVPPTEVRIPAAVVRTCRIRGAARVERRRTSAASRSPSLIRRWDGGVGMIDTADGYGRFRRVTGHDESLRAEGLQPWTGPADDATTATEEGNTRDESGGVGRRRVTRAPRRSRPPKPRPTVQRHCALAGAPTRPGDPVGVVSRRRRKDRVRGRRRACRRLQPPRRPPWSLSDPRRANRHRTRPRPWSLSLSLFVVVSPWSTRAFSTLDNIEVVAAELDDEVVARLDPAASTGGPEGSADVPAELRAWPPPTSGSSDG